MKIRIKNDRIEFWKDKKPIGWSVKTFYWKVRLYRIINYGIKKAQEFNDKLFPIKEVYKNG